VLVSRLSSDVRSDGKYSFEGIEFDGRIYLSDFRAIQDTLRPYLRNGEHIRRIGVDGKDCVEVITCTFCPPDATRDRGAGGWYPMRKEAGGWSVVPGFFDM
jgi:hypothetical protein